MNLLMITGDRSFAAGKRGAFYATLEEFHKHWDRIDILCPRIKQPRYDMSVFGNVYVHPSPWPLLLQPLWILRQGLRVVRAHSPAVTTVHEYPPFYNGMGAWLLHKKTRIPYVLEIHHIPGYPRASGVREAAYRWLMRWFIGLDAHSSAAVRVVNQREAPRFLAAAGVPASKTVSMPSVYLDTAVFRPMPDVEKKLDIIFVGRLASNKGLDLFLEVCRLGNFRAAIVGDGPLLAGLQDTVRHQKLQVTFQGYAADAAAVARAINFARILAMFSYNEGGPRIVVEALACGVPVVATPVGMVPDVLPPEAIEQWNARDLTEKIKNILADRELYDRLRQSGLAVAERFERTGAIRAYADGLKEIAQRP